MHTSNIRVRELVSGLWFPLQFPANGSLVGSRVRAQVRGALPLQKEFDIEFLALAFSLPWCRHLGSEPVDRQFTSLFLTFFQSHK